LYDRLASVLRRLSPGRRAAFGEYLDEESRAEGQTMADVLSQAISKRLKEGMTLNAIARAAGIPQPVLYRFVNRKRDLTLRTAQKLADSFGLELVQARPNGGKKP
jgi:AcrR family transcriptional regulator